jgi:hypothetical protein
MEHQTSDQVSQDQGSDKDALKGESVALRQARQKAYRGRQREAAELLSQLWRLRRVRERGGLAVGLPVEPSWDDLAQLLRQMIHEETLLSAVTVARRVGQGARPKGAGLVLQAAEAAAASVSEPGLSTDHILSLEHSSEKEGSTTPVLEDSKKGSHRSTTAVQKGSKTTARKRKNGKS